MAVIAFTEKSKEKSKVLAELHGWSLATAEGYVDGQAFRKRHRDPSVHALVGIDDYSMGFRAGYFNRPLFPAHTPPPDRLSA
jgi:hypothetical protein